VRVTDGFQPAELQLPWDRDRNAIPDIGWRASDLEHIDDRLREEDADSEPEGDSQYPGDGLSAIEEYRGFIVDGAHRRTNPRRKDLFIHSTHPELIGDAAQLPLPIHLIELAEMTDLLTRVINPNFRNDGAGVPLRPESAIQRGLRVFDGGDSGSGVVGRVISLTNLPAPPNDIEAVIVYSQTIRRVSPDRNNATDIDSFDGQKNIQTLGHEIGHALQMYHWRKDTSSGESCAADPLMPDRALTVLVTCWFHPTNDLNDPKWNAIPHIYDEIDLRQLRIKK
jgi:hypothetical protein